MLRLFSVLFFCLMSSYTSATSDTQETSTLAPLIKQLPTTSLREMDALIEQIADIPSPQAKLLLEKLLDGDLYYLKANKQIVAVQINAENKYQLTDILTNETLNAVSKSAIKKVKTNNSLRGQIRTLLANLNLSNSDRTIRLDALNQLLNNPNELGLKTVKKRVKTEQDREIRELMADLLLIHQLEVGSDAEKMVAAAQLKDSLQPAVKNALVQQLDKLATQGEKTELKSALTNAIDKIEQQATIYQFAEHLFFGLSLGSVLLLAAIGLAITFGVMGVINMAHGEMMMLGAYTTYVIQQTFPTLIEYSLLMAIPAAFVVSGLVGILIERGVIRFLKGRPLETLLATFGISLILQQLVRTIFSPLNRQVEAPQWMTGSLQINPIFSLTYNRLYIILFSLMVFFSLLMILKKSSLGLHVRAVSQNRDMARALSIKSSWVDAITFGLGSGIAGIAGVVLSQLTNVGPNLGQAYIIDSFLVVVFGGVGNLWGTLVAALTLGTFNKFLEPWMGPVLANIIVLVGLVLFIQKRPKGLFPQKGRAAE
ncbi:urea ABC transporter permease subunit UrtB [Psychromonas sp. MME1]|uniref:urea ABC transporter permease subunit UrtB n=2 Tax=unclassified Psychromonas TaxID=2614957 RepID=UPI0034E22EBD